MAAEPAAAGRAVDITTLFRGHYAELARLAVMLVGDRPTAEDVVQDVFARLHARRDQPGPAGDRAGLRADVRAQARPGPGGKSLTVVLLTGRAVGTLTPRLRDLRVLEVPLTGGPPRLLYRGAVDGPADVFLGADASGRYLLLCWKRNGWIDHGWLRPLPPQGGAAFAEAW